MFACIRYLESLDISIHALRVEGDLKTYTMEQMQAVDFYPRPPGGGRLAIDDVVSTYQATFLSTPSGWRATNIGGNCDTVCVIFLSTPSGWRATDDCKLRANAKRISIHALRVEGDWQKVTADAGRLISIHALRVEGDRASYLHTRWADYFYPRPPGGGRQKNVLSRTRFPDFYPRPPGGGRQQKQTKFSSVFAQKGEEFASLRRGKRKFAGGVLKRTNFGF